MVELVRSNGIACRFIVGVIATMFLLNLWTVYVFVSAHMFRASRDCPNTKVFFKAFDHAQPMTVLQSGKLKCHDCYVRIIIS